MKSQKNSRGNKVVITGGAGFIGSHIVDLCVARGYETHIIDDLSSGKESNINKKAIFHNADVRNRDAITPIIAGATYVFHTAARARVQFSIEHPIKSTEANVMGTLMVLMAARDGKVKRVIYSASSSAYGDQTQMPLREDMALNPLSPYGLQKHVGELYARVWQKVYGLESVCLRYFNVYGPRLDPEGDYALVIGKFLKQRREGTPLTVTGDGTQTRDFTHVRDVARANLLAAESKKVGKGEVINIGAGRNIAIKALAKLVGGKVEHIPPRLEPHDTLADNSLAKKLLGWTPEISLEDGIRELKKEWGIRS